MKGKHTDVVHRPNTDPHGQRPTGQPNEADPGPCRGYSAGQVKRRISREYRDNDRQGDETIVVRANQGLIGSGHNLNLHYVWRLMVVSCATMRYVITSATVPN